TCVWAEPPPAWAPCSAPGVDGPPFLSTDGAPLLRPASMLSRNDSTDAGGSTSSLNFAPSSGVPLVQVSFAAPGPSVTPPRPGPSHWHRASSSATDILSPHSLHSAASSLPSHLPAFSHFDSSSASISLASCSLRSVLARPPLPSRSALAIRSSCS